MNFEPQKFFIGLMEFFSILLPGALLTWLLMGDVGPVVLGDRYAKLEGAQAWAAFLFASYLFGHLVFLVGSWLDDLYDWARSNTLNKQITRLALRGRLLPWLVRVPIWLVFRRERNLAVDRAGKIRQRALGTINAKQAINTFQWSKAWLAVESPESLAVVQRFEADSKFFRSFTVVLVILGFTWPLHKWPLAGIPVVMFLILLALWRYMEQRHKATNQAYWSVITLTANEGKLNLFRAPFKPGSATRAGGVVYRMRGGQAEYLLMEAKGNPAQCVLPRGDIEEGEQDQEAAVRAVHAKTGVWARIQRDLGDVCWHAEDAVVKTRFFLMEAVGRGWRDEKDREHAWFPMPQAAAHASLLETRELLLAAEQHRLRGRTPLPNCIDKGS